MILLYVWSWVYALLPNVKQNSHEQMQPEQWQIPLVGQPSTIHSNTTGRVSIFEQARESNSWWFCLRRFISSIFLTSIPSFFSTLNWEMSQACQLAVSRNIYCLNVSLLQYCRILLNVNRWYSKKNCCSDSDLIWNINNENFKTVLGVKLCHAWVVRK